MQRASGSDSALEKRKHDVNRNANPESSREKRSSRVNKKTEDGEWRTPRELGTG